MTAATNVRRAWARAAGLLLILTNATAIFANWARDGYLVAGDAAATAAHMAARATLVRLGLAAELVTVAGVVPLVIGLYVVLKPAGPTLALLALAWRILENAIMAMLVFASLAALTLVGGGDYLRALAPGETSDLVYTLVHLHRWGFQVGFLFLGLGQTLFSCLWWTSRAIPRWLAGLGICASALLAAMALIITVWPWVFERVGIAYMMPMGMYEIGLGLWLGVRAVPPHEPVRASGD